MGFYRDFLKAEKRNNKDMINLLQSESTRWQTFEREMTNKKVASITDLSNSIDNLSNAISNIQPIVLCISVSKDTDPKDLKKLIEGLK